MATTETTRGATGASRRRPQLRTVNELAGERHASWLELFFDLIFVIAVSQVAHALGDHLSGVGFLQYLLLSALVWWAWVGYSFYADRFESDEPTYRLLMFGGMLAVAAVSTNIGGAFGDTGGAFAISYAVVRGLLVVLYLRAVYYVPIARELTVRFSVEFGAILPLWIASAFVAPPARYWLWVVAILAETATPFLNARATRRVPMDLTHIPERFGLFTLIVIGEVVAQVVGGGAGSEWRASSALVAICGFGVAAAIWWINFEFVHTPRMRAQSSVARTTFLFGHFLSTIGIVATGVGVNRAIRHAAEPFLPVEVRLVLCGGVALFLVAVSASHVATRCVYFFSARLGAALALLALVAVGAWVPPLAFLALMCATLGLEAFLEARTAAEVERDDAGAEPDLSCAHTNVVRQEAPATEGCTECLAGKQKWVNLRMCMTCGNVGCCDSSKNKHATRHWEETGHPVMRSIEPGDSWVWCYLDQTFLAGEWIHEWTGPHVHAPEPAPESAEASDAGV
jgi:low temperature requirement protein LtrA